MKCPNCGGAKMAARKQSYLYSEETGLPVTLAGIEVQTCPDCGETGPVIPQPLDLHAALVYAIARKPGRLHGAEVTFLRKALARNGRELSSLMGCTPTNVSRWEGNHGIGVQADKLLRLAAVLHSAFVGETVAAFSMSDLELAASEESTDPLRFTMVHERGRWKVAGRRAEGGLVRVHQYEQAPALLARMAE